MTWSFALLLERTFQHSKSLRASAETTVRGRTAWPWFHGTLGIAPLGTWPSSTHSRHHNMSHRALCRPEAQRQPRRTGVQQVQQPVIQPFVLPCGCWDSWRTGWWWTQVHSGDWQEGCTKHCRFTETTFLYQRFSIAIQRFNSICLANSFSVSESSG